MRSNNNHTVTEEKARTSGSLLLWGLFQRRFQGGLHIASMELLCKAVSSYGQGCVVRAKRIAHMHKNPKELKLLLSFLKTE